MTSSGSGNTPTAAERIAAVLSEHHSDRCWWRCRGGTTWKNSNHNAHVAEEIVAALELQEEWTALPRERLHLGAPKLFPSHAAAKAHRDGWVPGWVLFSRLVSRWVGEETKP